MNYAVDFCKMRPGHVALINLQTDLTELLRYNLEKEQVRVRSYRSGVWALSKINPENTSLIICESKEGDLPWYSLLQQLKHSNSLSSIPFILLGEPWQGVNQSEAFNLGVEAFYEKPLRLWDLLQKTRRILSNRSYRTTNEPSCTQGCYEFNHITVNSDNYSVWIDHKHLEVSEAEFRLLKLFVCKPGKVYTQQYLEEELRDLLVQQDASIAEMVKGLRKKLGRHQHHLEYLAGIGYRLNDQLANKPEDDDEAD